MRDIKFRAWDTVTKTMGDVKGIDYLENQMLVLAHTTRPYRVGQWIDSDRYELLQYTGLKDSTKWEQLTPQEQRAWIAKGETEKTWKGKKIYEGDILKGSNRNYPVTFNETEACFEAKNHPGFIPAYSFSKYQVIGNIYEHLELIQDKQL